MADEPLADLTVLDMCQAIAGPTAGVLLADFGADVVSIEPPGGGSERSFAKGAALPNVARNKRSVVLDLKTAAGREALYRLVETTDVLLHNNRPGKMRDLGCDYETLSERNPALVYCSITGYGKSGPYRERPGFDPLAQAMSGLLWMTGESDRKPSRVGASTIDICTGVFAAFAVWPAIRHAERTGEGQEVEASLLDTAAAFMGQWYTYYDEAGTVPQRQGHSWDAYAPAGLVETETGLVYLAAPTDDHWEGLCGAIDRRDLIDDPRFETGECRVERREELFEVLDGACREFEAQALVECLAAAGVPAAVLNSVPEAVADPHLRKRGTVQEMADVDGTTVLGASTPVHLTATPARIETGPPQTGEHTREVLSACGYDESEIDRLVADGVVAED